METLTPQVDPAKLKNAREEAKLSQREMGAVIGASKQQVSNIESGFSGVNASKLHLWAQACNVKDLSSLYTNAPPNAFRTRKAIKV